MTDHPSPLGHPGELLVVGYEGLAPPPDLLARIAAGQVGGVILFARNIASPAQTADAIRTLVAATPADAPPLIVAVDQEGGRVQRLREPLARWPAMARLGATGDEALAERVGAALGAELRLVGFNLDFAPVLDMHTNPANQVIGDRAFGNRPAAVIPMALAFWRGLESAGVRGCGKHFPGHGDTLADSHLDLPRVDGNLARLESIELAPFAAAARAGVPMLMTAHVVAAALDADWPATMSPAWIDGVLRARLGYAGVVITDDLDMRAVADRWPVEEVVTRALGAGVDMMLACRDPDRQRRAADALVRAATDPSLAPRIEAALTRARAFRRTLTPPTPASSDEISARLPDPIHQALAASF